MSKRAVGLVSCCVLVGAGLFLAWQYRDGTQGEEARQTSGAAARREIMAALNMALPAEAADEFCFREEAGVAGAKAVYARFDVPAAGVGPMFERLDKDPEGAAKPPRREDLRADAVALSAIAAQGASAARRWWQVMELPDAVCGAREGTRSAGTGRIRWRVQACVGTVAPGVSRVYLALTEKAE